MIGNGSGDIVISFSTANKINHNEKGAFIDLKIINENHIDSIFEVFFSSLIKIFSINSHDTVCKL